MQPLCKAHKPTHKADFANRLQVTVIQQQKFYCPMHKIDEKETQRATRGFVQVGQTE